VVEERRITRRAFARKCAVTGAAAALGTIGVSLATRLGGRSETASESRKRYDTGLRVTPRGALPNIVIIHADDLGWGDLGCYGSKSIKTPHLDRLAREGMRFTDFYSSNALCTPSRFGLLTGRYPKRVGLHWVLWMEDLPFFAKLLRKVGRVLNAIGASDIGADCEIRGIPAEEITIAEGLRAAGYRTGCIGKWHLGDFRIIPEYNPCNHGFDYFYGLPWDHEEVPCPLYRNHGMVREGWNDLSEIHQVLADGAVDFIEREKGNAFFLYYAPPDPHVPLHPSERFRGKSAGGIYGDVVEELDANVGRVLDCLKRNGLERKTLVIFTSDNGPWYHGSTGGQRGRKGQSYEGGFNVPMIARWPGRIQPGTVCSEPSMNIDLLPTCFAIAGVSLPEDRIVDGRDIGGLLAGTAKKSPHEALYFYHHDELEGVRVGRWKFYQDISTYTYPLPVNKQHFAQPAEGPWLYDLEKDPYESYPVNNRHPEVVEELLSRIRKWEREMKANPKGKLRNG